MRRRSSLKQRSAISLCRILSLPDKHLGRSKSAKANALPKHMFICKYEGFPVVCFSQWTFFSEIFFLYIYIYCIGYCNYETD